MCTQQSTWCDGAQGLWCEEGQQRLQGVQVPGREGNQGEPGNQGAHETQER